MSVKIFLVVTGLMLPTVTLWLVGVRGEAISPWMVYLSRNWNGQIQVMLQTAWGSRREIFSDLEWKDFPVISPDGGWVYSIGWQDNKWGVFKQSVQVNQPIQRLTQESLWYETLSVSPDGQHLVVTVLEPDTPGRRSLYLLTVSDGEFRHLSQIEGDLQAPEWSSDGWLAFAGLWEGESVLYRMDTQYGDLIVVTDHGDELGDVVWSPDSDWLIFSARVRANWDIYRIRPDGTQLQRLTQGNSLDFEPSVSPDGRWIVYTSITDSVPYLQKMRSSGGQAHTIVAEGWGGQWSPDGDWISYGSMQLSQRVNETLFRTDENGHTVELLSPSDKDSSRLVWAPVLDWSLAGWRLVLCGLLLAVLGLKLR